MRLLALTHISSRYFGGEAADEARQVFPETVVPRDFDIIEIPFPERGDPVLVPRGARRAAAGPLPTRERAGNVPDFGARARVYDTLRPADAAWWEAFAALVELGDLRGRRVLDVGCGTGRLAAALANEAHAKVWGIDASAEMVAVARETLPAGVGIRQGAAERLPFRDGWFDRVTMSLVIHLVDRPQALAEARRVVPADGRIAISTFHPDHFASYWLNPFFPSIREIDEARFPTPGRDAAGARRGRLPAVREHDGCTATLEISREDALARIRGRHISTFDLLPAAEIEEGTARAERELPDRVVTPLDRLVVVGIRRLSCYSRTNAIRVDPTRPVLRISNLQILDPSARPVRFESSRSRHPPRPVSRG